MDLEMDLEKTDIKGDKRWNVQVRKELKLHKIEAK